MFEDELWLFERWQVAGGRKRGMNEWDSPISCPKTDSLASPPVPIDLTAPAIRWKM